jgi:hypothetical protein
LALRYNSILTVFLISLLFFSCESVTEGPFEHKYVINLVLRPNIKFQKAYVDSTYRLGAIIPEGFKGIRDAEIFAIDEQQDTFKFSESDTIGIYYSNDSMWVKYSNRYFIQVNVEGHHIEKEVNIPGSLFVYAPSNGDTVSLDSPEIVYWNNCEGSFENMYNVRVFFEEELDSFYTSLLTQDTSLDVFSARYLFPNVDTFYTLAIMAMDENCFKSDIYFDYDQLDEDFAMGVIGATVLDTIKVWVTE